MDTDDIRNALTLLEKSINFGIINTDDTQIEINKFANKFNKKKEKQKYKTIPITKENDDMQSFILDKYSDSYENISETHSELMILSELSIPSDIFILNKSTHDNIINSDTHYNLAFTNTKKLDEENKTETIIIFKKTIGNSKKI